VYKKQYNLLWRLYRLETIQSDNQTQPEPVTEQPANWKRFALDILETLVLAVVLYFGINAVSARVRVDGFSMRPTLQDGEYILVNKLAYKFSEPVRGDIVVFKFPINPEEDLIKRIIGLPGDTIAIQDGVLSVNGAAVDEPYINAPPVYNGTWQVSEGELFVLGDNRNDSRDSHQWGLLPIENVIGRAVLIYWPPEDWQVIRHINQAGIPQATIQEAWSIR
jgi:signal peptidase I